MATSTSSAASSAAIAKQAYMAASEELLVKHKEIAAKGTRASFAENKELSELSDRVRALYSQALYGTALLKNETYDEVMHHRYNERLEIVSHYKKLNACLLGIDFPQTHPINLLFQALVNKNADQARTHFRNLDPETQATACFYAYDEQTSMNPEAKSEGFKTIISDPIYALNKRCLYSLPVISVLIGNELMILNSKIDSEKQKTPLEQANTIEQANANLRAKLDYYKASDKLKKRFRAIAAAVETPSQNEIEEIAKLTATVRGLYQQALQQNQGEAWLPYHHQRLEALLAGKDLPDDHPVIQLEKALHVDIDVKDTAAILKAFNALDRCTKKIAYKMAYQNDTGDYKDLPWDYWNECGAKLMKKDPVDCLTKANNQYRRVIDFLVKNEFELLQSTKNSTNNKQTKGTTIMSTFDRFASLNWPLPHGSVAVTNYLLEADTLEYVQRSVNRRGNTVSPKELEQLKQLTERVEKIYTVAQSSANRQEKATIEQARTRLQKIQAREEVDCKETGYFLELAMMEKDKPGAVEYFSKLQYKTQMVAFKFITNQLPSPNKGKMVGDRKGYVYDALIHLSKDFIYCLNLTTADGVPLYEILKDTEYGVAATNLQTKVLSNPSSTRSRTYADSHASSTSTTTTTTRQPAKPSAPATNPTAKKGGNANDKVTDRLLQITLGLPTFDERDEMHGQAVNFLTTPDNAYAAAIAKNPNNEVIGRIYGDLIFHPKSNSEDQDFLDKMGKRQWFKPACDALKAHVSYAGLLKGSKIIISPVLICHYLTEVMNWTKEEKNDAYRFLKEVIKHCILRDDAAKTKQPEKSRSRQVPDLTRRHTLTNIKAPNSKNEKARNDLLIPFYTQGKKNDQGMTFEKILAMSDAELEKNHVYIQWLFPLFTASDKNPTAPVLNTPLAIELANNAQFQANLLRAFERMIRFYGFKIEMNQSIRQKEIVRDIQKPLTWLSKKHNFLRITRILKCVTNLADGSAAKAFLNQLEIVAASKEGQKAIIPADQKDSPLGIWRNAVQVQGQHVLVQQQQQHHHHHHQHPHHHQHHSNLHPSSLLPSHIPLHPYHQQQQQQQQQQQHQPLYPQLGDPLVGNPMTGPTTVIIHPNLTMNPLATTGLPPLPQTAPWPPLNLGQPMLQPTPPPSTQPQKQ